MDLSNVCSSPQLHLNKNSANILSQVEFNSCKSQITAKNTMTQLHHHPNAIVINSCVIESTDAAFIEL